MAENYTNVVDKTGTPSAQDASSYQGVAIEMEYKKPHWDWKLKDRTNVSGGSMSRRGTSGPTLLSTNSSAVTRHSHHMMQRAAVSMVRSFYDLSALQWDRRDLKFSRFEGKVVLVVNTATAHAQSSRQFIQLNELSISRRHRGLVILAFPCNLLNNGEPWNNSEIMNCLRYVRPGGNFKPRFYLMAKIEVNGTDCHPVYEYLKQCLPLVSMATSATLRSDISANFEKLLINHHGKPVKRLPAAATSSQLEDEIDLLLKNI